MGIWYTACAPSECQFELCLFQITIQTLCQIFQYYPHNGIILNPSIMDNQCLQSWLALQIWCVHMLVFIWMTKHFENLI